ncbi:MAG: metallophosphoesterase [Candidatus Lokiarchaeota archaeon]|nr:metallophosphoesterase [Candidatus Lokiarchaeota archaeon]
MNTKETIIPNKLIFIDPNLGHPKFITFNPKNSKENITANLLFISNISSIEDLKNFIEDKITLIPILDYKWKLKEILLKERKKHSLGLRISLFFKRKKKQERIEDIIKKLRPRGFRGDTITPSIVDIKKIKSESISDLEYLEANYFIPKQFLDDIKVSSESDIYYQIIINFSLSKEVLDLFKDRKFIMFDIKGPLDRVNSHSLVITKQNWKKFSFIQITDTHLAERNDRIYEIVTKWFKSSIRKNADKFYKTIRKKISTSIKKSSKEDIKRIKKPLRKRLINPNNQLRKFIKLANREVIQNNLDFIVLTGDIVDYVIKTKHKQQVLDIKKLEMEHSNWSFFKDIILNNKPNIKYKGVLSGEELLCPIITILGNHDYRPNHYDLTWGGLYKKMGLNSSEALALNELLSASPISAIIKSKLALKNYLTEISCVLDFSLILGDFHLIFLNSGSDSFKNIRDFLKGHPSVTGLKRNQIRFLERLINDKKEDIDKIILLLHGPPINIGKKPYLKERIKVWSRKDKKKSTEEIKDSKIIQERKKEKSKRIDNLYNVKHGTISSNWEKLIDFCKNYTILTLSGHTHALKEFKLGTTTDRSTVFNAPPFILKKIENPAAIYHDIYSEKHTNAKEIEKNLPYITQTPALGLGNFKNPKSAGAYRIMKIKNNYLCSFKVKYLK